MKIRPLHDRVLVKRVAEEDKTAGGLIIPEAAKEKQARGQIVAVGNGRVDKEGNVRALDVKKGDEVLFGKYAGTEIKVEGEEFLILLPGESLKGAVEVSRKVGKVISSRGMHAIRALSMGSRICAQIFSGESANRSSVWLTAPSVEFSIGTTP